VLTKWYYSLVFLAAAPPTALLSHGALAWALLAVAAVLVGISKTALPGINTISIAIFAALIPAKQSTGALLLLLIVGDIFALAIYRKDANWPVLLRLIPAVLVGLALGGVFLAVVSDAGVRTVIGIILLLVIGFTLWMRWRKRPASAPASRASSLIARSGYGALGGFTTMVANAGGPVMSMYFLASRFTVREFLGTAAWFFATINLTKVPISFGLGLINAHTALLALILLPAVVIGALVGKYIASRLSQSLFDWLVIVLTVLGSVYLIVT
jgi:uncharacterized membrane protein YfcA